MITKTTLTLLPLAVFSIFNISYDFQRSIPQPAEVKLNKDLMMPTRLALYEVGIPKEKIDVYTNSCYFAGQATGIDPILIVCVLKKESEGNENAKSKAGYVGPMQTKVAFRKLDYSEADVMAGACDLRNKLKITGGNLEKAMTFYKGHGGAESARLAKQQLEYYRTIRDKVNQQTKEMEKTNDRYRRKG